MSENAENGRCTTIVFSYYRWGPMYRQTTLYKYDSRRYNNMAAWTPNSDAFHGPYYDHANKKIITGYLNYDFADVLDCLSDACYGTLFHNVAEY